MLVTIPHATKPPALDGKIDAGEWDDAAAVTGIINQLDKVAHPRQATFWLKYDDKNLYIAQRSTLLPAKRSAAVMLPFGDEESLRSIGQCGGRCRRSISRTTRTRWSIALAPNRINSGDTPSWYRFMANINSTVPNRRELCDQIKGLKLVSISSRLDSLDVLKAPNNAKAFNTFNADDTVWESEYVIPLAEMKVDKAPTGEDWGFCWRAIIRSSTRTPSCRRPATASIGWRATGATWRVTNAYDLEKEYARAQVLRQRAGGAGARAGRFARRPPQGQVRLLQSDGAGNLGDGEACGRRQDADEKIELAARRAQGMDDARKSRCTRDHAADAASFRSTTRAGKPLYQPDAFLSAPVTAQDRTTLVPDMWFSGEPKMCCRHDRAVAVYNPIRNTLWVIVQLAGRPDEEDAGCACGSDGAAGRGGEAVRHLSDVDKPQGMRAIYELHTKLPS